MFWNCKEKKLSNWEVRDNILERLRKEFDDIFYQISPKEKFTGKNKFWGWMIVDTGTVHVHASDGFSDIVSCTSFHVFANDGLGYHEIHLAVCEALKESIKDLEKKREEKFIILMQARDQEEKLKCSCANLNQ